MFIDVANGIARGALYEGSVGPRRAQYISTAALLMLLTAYMALLTRRLAHLSTGQVPSRVDQVVWPMDLVVAFPGMFWAGLWLWRRQPLGYVVAAVLLVKAGLLGVTLVVNTWIATTLWDAAADPMLPVSCTWRLRWTGARMLVPAARVAIYWFG